MRIQLIEADITSLPVDAIVNAANESLLGGGGVDGAIHRAAGPALMAACRALPEVRRGVRCPTGEARLTLGFALPARFIIHTVGPIWEDGHRGEPALLAACYTNVLKLARENSVASLAFPAISAGVYGYPPDAAARVAIETIRAAPWQPQALTFCTFGPAMTRIYESVLGDYRG